LARKTPLKKPNRGEGIVSTMPRPKNSARLRPHGPGAPKNWGPMVLLEIIHLYSYMTFENAQVAKIGNFEIPKIHRNLQNLQA